MDSVPVCRVRGNGGQLLILLTLKGDIVSVGEGEGATGAVIFLESPRRLARPRTPPFHGDNMGSNPIGDTNQFKGFDISRLFEHYGLIIQSV